MSFKENERELGEFSVYRKDKNGDSFTELKFGKVDKAMKRVQDLIKIYKESTIKNISEIIITDKDDFTVLLWEYDKGFSFPENFISEEDFLDLDIK